MDAPASRAADAGPVGVGGVQFTEGDQVATQAEGTEGGLVDLARLGVDHGQRARARLLPGLLSGGKGLAGVGLGLLAGVLGLRFGFGLVTLALFVVLLVGLGNVHEADRRHRQQLCRANDGGVRVQCWRDGVLQRAAARGVQPRHQAMGVPHQRLQRAGVQVVLTAGIRVQRLVGDHGRHGSSFKGAGRSLLRPPGRLVSPQLRRSTDTAQPPGTAAAGPAAMPRSRADQAGRPQSRRALTSRSRTRGALRLRASKSRQHAAG